MTHWFNEHFAPGPLFLWVSAAAVVLLPAVWIMTRRRRPTVRFSATSLVRAAGTSWAVRVRFIVPVLRTLAISALVVALLRPQSGGEYQAGGEGIAIQMVLDVSGSMREPDFVIDGRPAWRLDAVKKVFEEFILGTGSLRGREGDLIGMTKFAKYADTACPLTLDHGSLRDLLRETEIPGWVNGQQVRENEEAGFTALGDAIVQATDDLRRAGEQAAEGVPGAEAARSRVMILLTDGANNPAQIPGTTPPDPIEAARVAATLGIKVYTIGAVGRTDLLPRGPALLFQQRAGFDEGALQEIARITGAKYFRATDTDSLVTIYDEIDKLERTRTGERSFRDNITAARTAMLVGLGLLMAEMLLVNTRFRRIP